jgi:ATPase subunit of ABC transporter with duplicated ATPase domains
MLFTLISNINFSYQNKNIFKNLNLQIDARSINFLIGPNGSGKSTLLSLMSGDLKPDEGNVKTSCNTEFLHQDIQEPDLNLSVSEFIQKVTGMDEDWVQALVLETADLTGLSLNLKMLNLSGGQKTRLSLSSILTKLSINGDENRTLLLLDEPANNLDAEGIDWLISSIRNFRGAILISTHDRWMMDSLNGRILEIKDLKLNEHNCSYTDYLQEVNNKRKLAQDDYEKNLKEKKKLTKLVQDLRQESHKVSHAKYDRSLGVPKMSFNKTKNSLERSIGSRTSALNTKLNKAVADRPELEETINIKFKSDGNFQDREVIKLSEIGKKFGDKQVLDYINMSVIYGQNTLVSGRNGSGKTTLLKIIANILKPDQGELSLVPNLKIGYFSQDTYGLNLNLTVAEVLTDNNVQGKKTSVIAVQAGIKHADFSKRISQLSRGQQAKIGFIKLMMENPDVLILDEPTNHLDIKTKEAIESAISSFDGAIIIASHDKYLTSKIKFKKEMRL